MEDIFPLKEGVDYTKLNVTEEGEYSVTRRRDADRILSIMLNVVGDLKTKTITDSTGCIGGDTIQFSLHYKFVNSIEINETNFKALQNNVNVYGLKNVTLHNGDSTEIFNWKSDVLFIDPPWGGPTYKENELLELHMGNKRVDEWLEEILLRKIRPRYIFLKLPANYNFKRLNFLPNMEYIRPFRIRNYILIAITVHMPKP
jgi:hypothetical protein